MQRRPSGATPMVSKKGKRGQKVAEKTPTATPKGRGKKKTDKSVLKIEDDLEEERGKDIIEEKKSPRKASISSFFGMF